MIGKSTRWMLDAGLLRCPVCVQDSSGTTGKDAGQLDVVKDKWLVCRDCQRKYPVENDIPQMLIEVGDQYRSTPVEELE